MRYADIVLKDDIDYSGSIVVIDKDNATRYEPLQSIRHPVNNGHGDYTETVVLTFANGETEHVRGNIVSTGEI